MNRRLRNRHRWVMLVLGAVLPLGLSAALVLREPMPTSDPKHWASAEGLGMSSMAELAPDVLVLDASARWSDARIQCHVWTPAEGGAVRIELQALEDLALPDVLLYWGSGQSKSAGADLDWLGNEVLMGPFFGDAPLQYVLPSDASEGEAIKGRLFLFSLAHGDVIASASLEGLGD